MDTISGGWQFGLRRALDGGISRVEAPVEYHDYRVIRDESKPAQYTMASTEMSAIAPPEQYVLPATKYCPNNEMPVLIYRNVLPSPRTEKVVQEWIEKNGWLRAVSVD